MAESSSFQPEQWQTNTATGSQVYQFDEMMYQIDTPQRHASSGVKGEGTIFIPEKHAVLSYSPAKDPGFAVVPRFPDSEAFINDRRISHFSRILDLVLSFASFETTHPFPEISCPPSFIATQGRVFHRVKPSHENSAVRWLLYHSCSEFKYMQMTGGMSSARQDLEDAHPDTSDLVGYTPEVRTQSIDTTDVSRSWLNIVESGISQKVAERGIVEEAFKKARKRRKCHVNALHVKHRINGCGDTD
ncbi:hypothetical protein B0H13DRAFT_1871850 [Mycena leptocephala]|nr:hypothetical protein B0H13DRAFT_1871850 [Mycena leptocephala]